MNLYQIQALYARLYKVINALSNLNLSKLDELINDKVAIATQNSFRKWYESIPASLISEFYGSGNEENAIYNLQQDYSTPYLHLDDNDWALAIFSKNWHDVRYNSFINNNGETINRLADEVTLALQYIDPIEGELSPTQKQTLFKAEQFISKNANLVEQAEKLIAERDKIYSDKNLKQDIRVNQDIFTKYFNQTDYKDFTIQRISSKCYLMLDDLELISIKEVRKKIKDIWKELKEISLKKDLQIANNVNIQAAFRNYPQHVINVINQFENLENILNESDQRIKSRFNLTTAEIMRLKDQARKIINSAGKRAYPNLNKDNLSSKELELLSLVNEYESYPQKLDEKVKETVKRIKKVENELDQLNEIALTRKDANLLDDSKFEQWINLENEIYNNYVGISQSYEEVMANQPVAEKNPHDIQNDYSNKSAEYFAVIEDITGEKVDVKGNSYLSDYVLDQINRININTQGLNVVLRQYQVFAAKYILFFKHVLLGDQMGLGKTLEALTVANQLYQKSKTHTIVISPYGVLENWNKEISKRTDLPVYKFHGSTGPEMLNQWENKGGILLTNYEQCAKIIELEPTLKSDLIVVDEAHNIKHKMTKRASMVMKLLRNSEYQLLMTGTPIENNQNEMNSLISIVRPDLGAKLVGDLYIGKERYKKEIAGVYLRRKREDVLKELPLVILEENWSKFNSEQQDYYDRAVEQGESGFQKMRRAAFIGKDSEKVEQIKHICEDARKDGEKVIVFSFFKEDVVYKLQKELPHVASQAITGDIRSSEERQDIIDEFSKSPDETVLVCQINAAGIGLNIQVASQVIICEPQMKPSTENQAISRAYRMGQTKNVTVFHMLTENSIDEIMMSKLNFKQKIFDKYADDSVAARMFQDSLENEKLSNQSSLKKEILRIEQKRLAEKRLDKDAQVSDKFKS